MSFKCIEKGTTKKCLTKIQAGSCPCVTDLKLYGRPIIMSEDGLCIMAMQLLLHLNFCLLINRANKQIIFHRNDKKNIPTDYKMHPAIKRGENKKCLPPQFMVQRLS